MADDLIRHSDGRLDSIGYGDTSRPFSPCPR